MSMLTSLRRPANEDFRGGAGQRKTDVVNVDNG